MDGKLDLLTILAIIGALLAVLKLRSVLGKDSDGGEERRAERMNSERRRAAGGDTGKVVTMPRRETVAAAEGPPAGDVAVADAEQRFLTFAGGDAALGQGLFEIYKFDQAFDPGVFVKGARQAYEMIVTAFAEGNRKTLKDLLSREVNDEFVSEMTARDKRGELIDQSFVGINKADIVEAEIKNGVANVTVRFVSQLITATRDRTGAVTSGDPQKIREVTDVWTFSRDVSSAKARLNLNWRVVATQEP
ncbi:MAG: Tim44/TimA family putative adaptor protein [Hyphomicrobiaceae bacterium]